MKHSPLPVFVFDLKPQALPRAPRQMRPPLDPIAAQARMAIEAKRLGHGKSAADQRRLLQAHFERRMDVQRWGVEAQALVGRGRTVEAQDLRKACSLTRRNAQHR